MIRRLRVGDFLIFSMLWIFALWGSTEEILQEANESYQQGEQATTYQERQLAFNRALFLYSTLEQQIKSPSAGLDQVLADTYFQLGEYAWAILYYERALKKKHLPLVLSHLEQAQKKLGLSPSTDQRGENQPFLSLPQQLQLIFWMSLMTFFVCSSAIWLNSPWTRKFATGSVVVLLLLICHLLFIYYSAPLEGILIKSTGFYRAPHENQSQLTNQPLLAGSKVQILQVTQNGEWLKIKDSEGVVGYIPLASLRSI